MREASVSTADLARHLKTSYQAVKKVLNGGKFGTENNVQAAKHLKVRSDWLATGRGPKRPGEHEIAADAAWPFVTVSADRVHALTPGELGFVEEKLAAAIHRVESLNAKDLAQSDDANLVSHKGTVKAVAQGANPVISPSPMDEQPLQPLERVVKVGPAISQANKVGVKNASRGSTKATKRAARRRG